MPLARHKAALILIDVQQAFLEWEAAGQRRNNPGALDNMARLLDGFRAAGMAIFHIRHASRETGSALQDGRPGHQAIPALIEQGDEAVLVKHVNSGFIGTGLEQRLRAGGFETLVIAGITTNHCVETTTRMAGNLGFDAWLVEDACYTFDRAGLDGRLERAEDIHRMTLSNLNGEFATIETTETVLSALASTKAA